MSRLYIVCAILVCSFGASFAAEKEVTYNCLNASVVAIDYKQLVGTWYEIKRADFEGSHEKNAECAQNVISIDKTGNGTYETKFRKQNGKKLDKQEKVIAHFMNSSTTEIELSFKDKEPKVILKLIHATEKYNEAVFCAYQKDKTSSGGFILSKKREISAEAQKNIDEKIKLYPDLKNLKAVEQNEKKCNGAASTVPVVGVLILSILSVIKAL